MKRSPSVGSFASAQFARHREFIGHVATLMSGKAFAGLVAIFTMPVVSRLFTPEHFGVSALFVSVVSMMASFATLSYSSAVVLPEDDTEAVLLMALAYRLLALTCGLMVVLFAAMEISGLSWRTFDLLGGWKWMLPAALLLTVGIRIQEYWLARSKSFRLVSVSLVAGNASTGLSRIALGFLGGSTIFGLIAGYMLGAAARLSVQWSTCAATLRSALRRIPASSLRDVGRRYADFPLYNMPASVIHTLGQNLPIVLFGVMFSPAVAGFFAMARQLLNAPIRMVSDSVRRVFLQKAASVHRRGRSLKKAYLLSTGALALAGLPPLLILSNFGQPLATWFLGDRWFEAGRYMEIIAPWLFMMWVMAPCKGLYIVLRRQRLLLWLELCLTVLRLGVFGWAYMIGATPQWTLQTFVTVTVIGNLATILVGMLLILRKAGGSLPPNPGLAGTE
jgi:O-antigen/teichoic acid export membrane protein